MDNKILFLFVALNCCISIFADANDSPIVEVKQGQILGKILTSRDGRDFYSFLGIPYGQADRFQVKILYVPLCCLFIHRFHFLKILRLQR